MSAVFVSWIRRPEPAPAPRDDGDRAAAVDARGDRGRAFGSSPAIACSAPSPLTVALGYLFGTIADSILILYLVTERGSRRP